MCENCYSTDHFKNSIECPGPREWEEYCQEFKEKWVELSHEVTDGETEDQSDNEEETRLVILNRNLMENLAQLQKEKEEVVKKVEKQSRLEQEVDDLVKSVKSLEEDKKKQERSHGIKNSNG